MMEGRKPIEPHICRSIVACVEKIAERGLEAAKVVSSRRFRVLGYGSLGFRHWFVLAFQYSSITYSLQVSHNRVSQFLRIKAEYCMRFDFLLHKLAFQGYMLTLIFKRQYHGPCTQ